VPISLCLPFIYLASTGPSTAENSKTSISRGFSLGLVPEMDAFVDETSFNTSRSNNQNERKKMRIPPPTPIPGKPRLVRLDSLADDKLLLTNLKTSMSPGWCEENEYAVRPSPLTT
jgi:hypothetical protein